MRGWLLDTNVVTELGRRRRDPKVEAWARSLLRSTVYISVLTLAEYDKGTHNLPAGSTARARIQAAVSAIELDFSRRMLSVSDAIVRRWGRLSGDVLQISGRTPAVIGTLLAATAIEHDLCLATRNVKDVRATGAVVFNPWTDDPGAVVML